MVEKTYKTVVVDDHPVVIEGIKNLLSGLDFITFCKGNSLFGYTDLSSIDILFLDVFLTDSNGIDLCLKLKKLYPKMIILGISSQSERSIVIQMIKNGANGYLLKSATKEEFKVCIENAIEGKIAFSDEVNEIMNKTSINDLKGIPRLTLREKEILILLKQGKSTQEIAEKLFLSYLTIQTHRRNLLTKFQVKNVVELINVIYNNGLMNSF